LTGGLGANTGQRLVLPMALRGSASVEKQLQEWSAELQSPRLH
jgi:hypothetical protein